jgi:hypothetical protein
MNSSASAPRRRPHEALKSRACTVLALCTPSRNVCEHAAALAECTRCSRAGTRRQEHRVAIHETRCVASASAAGVMRIESSIACWGYPQPNAISAPAKRCVQRESRVPGTVLPHYKELGDDAALSCTGTRLTTQRPPRSGVHHARAFHAPCCESPRPELTFVSTSFECAAR